jgi:hypothetical protein
MMRTPALLALLIGWAVVSSGAYAQEFRIEDAAAAGALPVAQLKPKTIAFTDQPTEELVDASTGFMRFEDWARAQPAQKQFLSLYPGYSEPNEDVVIDGVKKRYREKLHMYVAQARFVLARPPASLDLARVTTLPFVEQIDPAIKHRLITAADVAGLKDPKAIHNHNPQRSWCEGRNPVICLHSTYKLEGRLPTGIALANKVRESAKKVSDTLEFDSELAVLSPAQIAETGLTQLTGLDTPAAGAIEQSIFHVNQVMEFGRLVAIFQPHPADASKTVATVFIALAIESNILGKRKEFGKVPVLRNMVPAQVLAGKSSFNSGNSLSAGLPVYARNQVKAIAGLLERK